MNKTSAKTSAKKDEALKMAIEFMGTLTIDVGIKTWNEKHRKEAIQACKEALEPAQDFFERGKEIAQWADKQNEQPAQVTRLEVIDNNGRSYVNWGVDKLEFSYQDDGRTLKLFTNGAGTSIKAKNE